MTLRVRLDCMTLEARDNPSDPGLIDPYGTSPTNGSTDTSTTTTTTTTQTIPPSVLDSLYGTSPNN